MVNHIENIQNLRNDLHKYKNSAKAKILSRFFKSGKGEYGAGDKFLGITVPDSRSVAKQYLKLPLKEVTILLQSKWHEERLVALLLLVAKFQKGSEVEKKEVYKFYLSQTKYVNNWDLVDLSCSYIVGISLLKKDRRILEKLAKSKNLWERRIAIISTFAFIYSGESDWTFRIARILLKDEHDLIHKAVGWMLREVGKRVSEEALENFLSESAVNMPRTMLRYAIERLPEIKRKKYLKIGK